MYNQIILFSILIITLSSCKKDSQNTYNIDGVAQKGPYIVGTVVTISELDKNLNQTGKIFTSTIIDDYGKFEIPDVEFASKYVQLFADGNYYHELYNLVWPDRLVLTSIADLDETTTVNINILTHLEVERLKYLVREENLSFSEAKEQCIKEILNIFKIDSDEMLTSENLDISKSGNENIELLAISSMIQGTRQTSTLSEFLTRIQIDIKEDGILDSETLQSDLITSAVLTDCENISKNLKKRYSDLDLEIIMPDIRPIVDSFIEKSEYAKLIDIEIPENTGLGINILALADTIQIDTNQFYCLAINQICNTEGLMTWVRSENIENYYCRENIEITNVQNWGYSEIVDVYHPFGSNWPIDFYMESFSGNSNMKIAFKNHGKIIINTDIFHDEFGGIRKSQYLEW